MPNNAWQNAVYLQSGSPETENRPTSGYGIPASVNGDVGYPGQLGTRFVVQDRADSKKAKGYQLVQLDSAMTTLPTPGAVMFWRNRALYTVSTSVSNCGRGNPAGIARVSPSTADCLAGNLICVQILGPCPNVIYLSSPTSTPDTTGKIVVPSATDGQADCLAAGTAASYTQLGTAQGVVNASNQGLVELTLGVETP